MHRPATWPAPAVDLHRASQLALHLDIHSVLHRLWLKSYPHSKWIAGLKSVDALGSVDGDCDTSNHSVSDRVCKPNATVVGFMGNSLRFTS